MTAPDKSDVESGIKRAPGDEGLLDSRWSQALANRRREFLFDFQQKAPIVVTIFLCDLRGMSGAM